MKTVAIIPVKELSIALRRLAPLLSPRERRLLQTAMLSDVLKACSQCDQLERAIVVCTDPTVARLARSYGAEVVQDHSPPLGVNAAVTLGQRRAVALGAQAALILMADVPMVCTSDLSLIISSLLTSHGACVMVPARSGAGTNALAISPPDLVQPRFGTDSRHKYRIEIARTNQHLIELLLTRVALDIDTPDDVLALMQSDGPGPATRDVLRRAGIVAVPR